MDGSSFLDYGAPDLVAELRRSAAPVEGVFLEVGEHLSGAAALLGTISDSFGDLMARLDGGDLLNAIACLDVAARGVASIGHRSAGSLAKLERMESLVLTIRSRLGRLSKTIAEVRLLSINARVESAHVANRDVDFSVFTHEIGRLSDLAEAGLDNLGQELGALGALVSKVRDGQRRFEHAQRQSLATVNDRISHSLASSDAHRAEAISAVTAIAEEARRIGIRIGDVVMALQIGDITRQRVEHVCEALEAVPHRGEMPGEPQGGEQERDGLAAAIRRLQADQLAHAATDLEQGAVAAIANLAELRREAESVAVIGSRAFGGADGAHGSFLLDLSEQMRVAGSLMEGHIRARDDMDALLHAVSDRVSAMVVHVESVHSIEVDLRIMGLNATLKCGRLGDSGRALSVIAQTLRTYAGSTVADAGELMAGLEDIIAAAHELAAHGSGEAENPDLAGLVGTLCNSAAVLGTAGADMTAALEALIQTLTQVDSELARGGERLAAHDRMVADFLGFAGRLTAMASAVDVDSLEFKELQRSLLAQSSARYTMDREREIHLSHAVAQDCLDDQETHPFSPSAVSVDDLLF